ncbi:MAG: LPS-assembly protein LptD [Nitrospirae bacterium]|nr:LPS-assembly protein LptD [Nitrospirota bacterium]
MTTLCLFALVARGNCYYNASDNSTLAIKADSLQYNSKDKIYYLKGNASLLKGPSFVSADYIEFYEEQSVAVAKGDVYYDDKDITIRAHAAVLNTANKTGSLVHAAILVKNGNYHVTGDYLIKLSDKQYRAERATITTCDVIPLAWCLHAQEAEIDVDEEIRATNVIGKASDHAILYTPVFSAGLTRKTGFLMPGLGFHSDKGAYVSIPFYWAIAENRDMTIVTEYLSRRGPAEGIEYRYVEEGGIEGYWWAHYQHDKVLNKDYLLIKGTHIQAMDNGLSLLFNINYLNENDYFRQYSPHFQLTIQRFLESTAEAAYSTDKYRAYVLNQYFTDLQYKTALTSQTLPEAGFTLHPIDLWQSDVAPGRFSLTSAVSNFVSGDGIKGERLYVYPRLYSSTGDTVRFVQTAAMRADEYSLSGALPGANGLPGTDLLNKHIQDASLIYNAEVNTSLIRHYSSLTHVLEPSIGYLYVSDGPRVPELDSFEDFSKTSEVDLSLMNYFRGNNGNALYLKVSEPYYSAKANEQFGPLKLQSRLETSVILKADATYDLYKDTIKTANSEAKFNVFKADLLLGERYNKDNSILFLTGGLGYNIASNLRVNTMTWYDTKGNGLRNLTIDLLYSKQCWGLDVLYMKTPDRYTVYFFIELKGLGKYKFFGV